MIDEPAYMILKKSVGELKQKNEEIQVLQQQLKQAISALEWYAQFPILEYSQRAREFLNLIQGGNKVVA